jgi:hypothetical protein
MAQWNSSSKLHCFGNRCCEGWLGELLPRQPEVAQWPHLAEPWLPPAEPSLPQAELVQRWVELWQLLIEPWALRAALDDSVPAHG